MPYVVVALQYVGDGRSEEIEFDFPWAANYVARASCFLGTDLSTSRLLSFPVSISLPMIHFLPPHMTGLTPSEGL